MSLLTYELCVEQPFLICHGTNDMYTDIEGSRYLARCGNAKPADKCLMEDQDALHDLLYETDEVAMVRTLH